MQFPHAHEEHMSVIRQIAYAFITKHYEAEKPLFDAAWEAFCHWMSRRQGETCSTSELNDWRARLAGGLGFSGEDVSGLVTPIVLAVSQALCASHERPVSAADLQRITRKAAVALGTAGKLLDLLAADLPRLYMEMETAKPGMAGKAATGAPSPEASRRSDDTSANELSRIRAEIREIGKIQRRDPFTQIIGRSRAVRDLVVQILQVKDKDGTVLITGETGVGKEVVARAIHFHGPRRTFQFVPVHLAGMSDQLIESELFGHEKGAFTDARQQRRGRFEMGDGGTIFLDEIGDIGPTCQLRLLRVLEGGSFTRLGGNEPISVDVRCIAATNRDLPSAVKAGQFREELYYRLYVHHIYVPPLRERKEDIPMLVEHFSARIADKAGMPRKSFSEEAIIKLLMHDWPGNIRELDHCVERAIHKATGDVVQADDIDFPPLWPDREIADPDQAERLSIIQALESSRTVKSACSALRMPKSTFYDKVKRYGIDVASHLGRRL